MTSCEGLLRSGDGFGVGPREGSLRVARPAGADSRRREAGVLGGHADERRQRRCPAGRQPKGTPRPGRSALLRLLERAPPCRRRRASRPIPGRWRRARDPRGARPLARPKPRACLRNRPAAVGFAQPSVGREGANPFPAQLVKSSPRYRRSLHWRRARLFRLSVFRIAAWFFPCLRSSTARRRRYSTCAFTLLRSSAAHF